jgi:hypothetical protein
MKKTPITLHGGPPTVTIVDRPPSLLRKAGNFVTAAAHHVAAGSPSATDEQVTERFAICQDCELFEAKITVSETNQIVQGTCNHPSCGCSLKRVGLTGRNKLRWADQECPLKKWLAVEPASPDNSL